MAGFGNITIKTSVSRDFGAAELEVSVQTYIEEDGGSVEDVYLWARLAEEDGEEADRIFPVAAEAEVSFCMRAKTPRLWDAEQCCLYDLILELRGEENRLLACVTKKIAFQSWSTADGIYYLNGKRLIFAADENRTEAVCREVFADTEEKQREALGKVLTWAKRAHKNAVCVKKDHRVPLLREMCLEYGLYLLDGAPPAEQREETMTEFDIQVVEQGALIENHSLFADASRHDLIYEIWDADRRIQSGRTQAAVPPGSSRFVELPFARPGESGNYRYRVALCLKKDTPWAKKGFEAAAGEAAIANLWMG